MFSITQPMKLDCVSHFNIGAPNITHWGGGSHLSEIFMSKKKKKKVILQTLVVCLFYWQRFNDPCTPSLCYTWISHYPV